MGTHPLNAGGFLEGIFVRGNVFFSPLRFSVCGRWMAERKMYSLRGEESASVKFSKDSKFISESPVSFWPPRGRLTRFAPSSTHRSWEMTWLWMTSSPLKWSRTGSRLEASYKEPKTLWLLIMLTPTVSSWSSQTVRTQNGYQLRLVCRRGVQMVPWEAPESCCSSSLLFSSSYSVQMLLTPRLNKADVGHWMQWQYKQYLLNLFSINYHILKWLNLDCKIIGWTLFNTVSRKWFDALHIKSMTNWAKECWISENIKMLWYVRL